ncbi:hypothetical protein ACHAWU_007093 [Discostella pseudostelligera]|uniref:Methyltransferase type 12 domain-containing protein n=1 Tax=Discostella pseudostelligera TaxID=259834 RepID=A0ABD3N1N5_9STRA
MQSRSHSHENSNANELRLRASIRELQQLINGISFTSSSSSNSPLVPAHLTSLINDAAYHEDQSNLSNEMYESVVKEMALFVSSTIASFGKSFESEGVYNPELLKLYDALVWGFNSPFLWRITQNDISSLYEMNASPHNHCEIAVGTGLFLSELVALPSMKHIALLDLNENCLRVCEERIKDVCHRRHHHQLNDTPDNVASVPDVSKLLVDIMMSPQTNNDPMKGGDDGVHILQSPLTPIRGKFQSVGVNFLFHCLHGSNLYDKMHAFHNCASLLDPQDGVFFGSTILGKEMLDDEPNAGETAMHVLRAFNDMGVFGNLGDSFQDLEDILTVIFEDVDVYRVGYCGVWMARHPKAYIREE